MNCCPFGARNYISRRALDTNLEKDLMDGTESNAGLPSDLAQAEIVCVIGTLLQIWNHHYRGTPSDSNDN